MIVWRYDKTFEGLLTLVFDCYQKKVFPDKITGSRDAQFTLFQPDYEVLTDDTKAKGCGMGCIKRYRTAVAKWFTTPFFPRPRMLNW